jgi:hypothetical protein
MKAGNEGRGLRRARGRAGLTPVTAAIILGAVVLGAGAVSYVVLSAVSGSGTHSSTVHSCYPAKAPQCTGAGNTSGASYRQAVVVGLPQG